MIEKNKDAYENYVCPNCFNQLDKCICITFPPYYMTWIDVKIQEHVRILNKKGYFTKFSCEGHSKYNKTYILFVYDYVRFPKAPGALKRYVFNLADFAIFAGAIALLLGSGKRRKR